MFDFNKLSDMSKLAGQAKEIQRKQEKLHERQIELLEKISSQLEEAIKLLQKT